VDANAVVDLHVVGRDRSTSLHHAVKRPGMSILRSHIWLRQLDPSIADHQNRTALSWVVESGDLAIIDPLLTRPDIRVDPTGIHEDPILWLAIETVKLRWFAGCFSTQMLISTIDGVATSRHCYFPLRRAIWRWRCCFLPRVRYWTSTEETSGEKQL
jgi:hypothetical protein